MLRHVGAVAALVALVVPAVSAASAQRDGAVIVDSGSTNTSGYRIEVWSDGNATIVLQNRGVTRSAPKPFTIAPAVAAQFFASLKAARTANVSTLPCMKSASFGTTTRITWHDWTSPDLDCPSDHAVLDALIASLNKIRAASGIGTLPGVGHGAGGGPIRVQPSPLPSESPD